MYLNPHIFRGYDIRAIVGQDLNMAQAEALGKGYGTYLYQRKIKQAIVGRDNRLSGEEINLAFIKGLTSTGVGVVDIGMVMIQMVYAGQYYYQTNGAVMITASHNPSQYNGFKLANGFSKTMVREDLHVLQEIVEKESFYIAPRPGKVVQRDVKEHYYQDVLKRIHIKRKLKVVIDAGHGSAGPYMPELLTRAGCEVVGQHLEPDGSFPKGTPDPTATYMIDRLRDRVIAEKADLGVAFDGDADRIGVVDNTGQVLWNDVLVALFAQEILGRFPKAKIIYNNLCSQVVRDTIKLCGGQPIMWLTGHSFIKAKLAAEQAPFGGELSGHFFFADNFYGHDDGAFVTLRLLELISEKNISLHDLYKQLPQYISSPEIKVYCSDDIKREVIRKISQKFKADYPAGEISDETTIPDNDGVRIDLSDGMMIFRYSQNGPYLTVKFEAKDQATYDQRKGYVKQMLASYEEIDLDDKDHSVNLSSLD